MAQVQSDRDLEGAAVMTQMVDVTPASELFKGRQFDQEIIVLCVRRSLRYKLSFRDLVVMIHYTGTHHNPALGAALRAGIPETWEALCWPGRRLVAL